MSLLNLQTFFKCLFAFLLVNVYAYSQVRKFKFGDIKKEELSSKVCSFDSTAQAAILFDVGKDKIDVGTSTVFSTRSRHFKIKIYSKGGIALANQIISTFKKFESISNLKGFTYNLENNEIVKSPITKENIYDERVIDDFVLKKIAFPNVKEGSIIEIYYELYCPSGIRYYYEWQFQYEIPVLYSEYDLQYPDINLPDGNRLFFIKNAQGFLPLKSFNEFEEHYLLERIPAIDRENQISSINDFVSKIEFNFRDFYNLGDKYDTGTWEKLIEDLLKYNEFSNGFISERKASSETKVLLNGIENDKDKAKAIDRFVKENFKWNNRFGIIPTQLGFETLEKKTGSVADINLLLISFLKGAGLEADPVILSTRDHGKVIKSFPTFVKFNYLVCSVKIGNERFFLDATDPLMQFGMITPQALNGEGLVVKSSTKVEWVKLESDIKYGGKVNIVSKLSNEGIFRIDVQGKENGYKALEDRKIIRSENKREIEKELEKKLFKYEISNFQIAEGQTAEMPITIKYELEYSSDQPDKVLIEPMMAYQLTENPFKQKERQFPVDLKYMEEQVVVFTLDVPQNFEILEIPKNINIALPDKNTRFIYSVNLNENKLQITSKLIIDKQLYFAEEYPLLRNFYETVAMKHSEPIILKKK